MELEENEDDENKEMLADMTDRDFAELGFRRGDSDDGGDQSTMTGATTEQSDDFENYEEEILQYLASYIWE